MIPRDEYFRRERERRLNANKFQLRFIIAEFMQYLYDTDNSRLTFYGVDNKTYLPVVSIGEYVHRWRESYRKKLLARFYRLDDWFKDNPCTPTLMTLTTYHEGFLPDQISSVQAGWRKLRDNMYHIIGKFTYFYVLEPHEDGYVHLHALIFNDISDEQRQQIADLWTNKYRLGEQVDFKQREIAEGIQTGPKNYLMKYLSKTFNVNEMEDHVLLFNAAAWYMGKKDNNYKRVRFWNCSRDLQPILKLPKNDSDVDFYKVVLTYPDGEYTLYHKGVDKARVNSLQGLQDRAASPICNPAPKACYAHPRSR